MKQYQDFKYFVEVKIKSTNFHPDRQVFSFKLRNPKSQLTLRTFAHPVAEAKEKGSYAIMNNIQMHACLSIISFQKLMEVITT